LQNYEYPLKSNILLAFRDGNLGTPTTVMVWELCAPARVFIMGNKLNWQNIYIDKVK
jgi:hypothetical protein